MPRAKPAAGARALTRDRRHALAHLFEATRVAFELGETSSAFACQLASLHDAGVTDTTLRWLIAMGLAEHRLETTQAKQSRRTFRTAANVRFAAASCFILTPAGTALAGRCTRKRKRRLDGPHKEPRSHLPHYDAAHRRLLYRGQVVKYYKRAAANQELILLSFEEENWPEMLADPLPGKNGMDPKRRLNDAIKNLNAHHVAPLLRFHGDGSGTAIVWKKLP